jgi:hypothetical protein
MARVVQRQWVVLEERAGGIPPGSKEAADAIERVRRMLNPDVPQPSKPPAWSIKTTDGAVFRKTCERCGAGVQGKRLCKPCQAEIKQADIKTDNDGRDRRAKEPKPRFCLDCNADITDRGNVSTRCVRCQDRKEMLRDRRRDKVKRLERIARLAEQFGVAAERICSRPCEECRGVIAGKGMNSIICSECRVKRDRARKAQRRAEARAKRQQVSA